MSSDKLLYKGRRRPNPRDPHGDRGGATHPGAQALDSVAAGTGSVIAPGHFEIHREGRCEAPIRLRETAQRRQGVTGQDPGGIYDTLVRCRKCMPCKRYKRAQWTTAAAREMVQSARTWFGTLTVEPAHRYLMVCRAEAGRDPSKWTDAQRFQALWNELSREVTLWLKRARKLGKPGTRLRFMLTAEPHRDGFPHAHVLVHEAAGSITYRELRKTWRVGFSSFSIAKDHERVRHYAAKYITKGEHGARVRASLRYGAWRTASLLPEDIVLPSQR